MTDKRRPKTEEYRPKRGVKKVPKAPPTPLANFIVPAPELAAMEIPPREYIVEPFLPASSLSMVYAERGLGKTWFGMTLSLSICQGQAFLGRYAVPSPRNVLYIDGEMALPDLQDRVNRITRTPPETFMLLPSERLFREDRPLNVNDAEDQERINVALEQLDAEGRRPDLVVLDNLSSLSGGVDESDNSALDSILRWLIGLRHKGYAILLIHHAGKNGTQRGASRREDLLDTSIALKRPEGEGYDHPGAHFLVEFVKTRGKTPQPSSLELWLLEDAVGILTWTTRAAGKAATIMTVLRELALSSFKTQAQLAKQVGVSEGRVSQLIKKLRQDNLVDAQFLQLTQAGREYVADRHPDLADRLLRQGKLPLGGVKDDSIL